MTGASWSVRTATEADRNLLRAFRCADPTVAWQVDVENYIQRDVLDWAQAPGAAVDDPRVLLVLTKKGSKLIAVAAHERVSMRDETVTIAATKLYAVAVATAWQGKTLAGGTRASDVVMSAAMQDITTRVPPRDARVLAIVHKQNARSIALCRRYGFDIELSDPDPAYVRLVTS